jgi:hypothetical protein
VTVLLQSKAGEADQLRQSRDRHKEAELELEQHDAELERRLNELDEEVRGPR